MELHHRVHRRVRKCEQFVDKLLEMLGVIKFASPIKLVLVSLFGKKKRFAEYLEKKIFGLYLVLALASSL